MLHFAPPAGRLIPRADRVSVELVARRQPDLDQGHPDYSIYAGAQLVGHIYQQARSPEHWRWAINTVMIDNTAGAGMAGYAPSMEEAHRSQRSAFDRWLSWALATPQSDLKYGPLDKNLRAIGVR
jgi:hypothetical protein